MIWIKKNTPTHKDTSRHNSCHIFFHPDFTVGYGIAPYQLLLADYTAGQELHLAPKTVIFSVNYL